MVSFVKSSTDLYITDKKVWEVLFKFLELPPSVVIWESAYNKDSSLPLFRDSSLRVVMQDIDFFMDEPSVAWDIQITNPPFSKKIEWLRRSLELNKPFILLLPSDILHRKYFHTLFANKKFQIIIPPFRPNFVGVPRAPFESIFLCVGMNLKSDVCLFS